MDINDVSAENYFKKVTYASDSTTYTPPKLKIPDADFIHNAILLRLINSLEKLRMNK